MRFLGFLFCVFALILMCSSDVAAGGFMISSIGEVSTNNRQVSKFWHTSTNPTIRGVATPGADIKIDVDGTVVQVSANSSGDWVYTPSGLSAGDHVFTFTSNESTIKMNISLGKDIDWENVGGNWESDSNKGLPAAGVAWPTVGLIILAGGCIIGSAKFLY